MISRRDFSIRLVGILGIAGPAHLLDAQEGAAKPGATTASSPPAFADGLSQSEQEEVEHRYQNLLRVWGHRLSDEQRERVHRVLVANARMMQPMRAFQLENGDPPAEVLRVTTDSASAADGKQEALQDRPK
jgi:hypothetical protein